MPMEGYSDEYVPLYIESLVGFRSFRLKEDGLHPMFKSGVWTDGENHANCQRYKGGWSLGMFGFVPIDLQEEVEDEEPEEHKVAAVNCECGFYAYFEANHDGFWNTPFKKKVGYSSDRAVVRALIEGYGLVTVGTKGFRASKAKILCLIRNLPPEDFDPETETTMELAKEYMEFFPLAEERYGVPVFDTVDEALAAFPLSGKPEGKTKGKL